MNDFTLFWNDGYQPTDECPELNGCSLQEVIDALTADFGAPCAWMRGCPDGRHNRWVDLREQSVDAGRLIDCIGGRCVPRGEPVDKPCMDLAVAIEVIALTPEFVGDGYWRDAEMIARDGVAPKATTVALPTPPLTTAHPAIKGLTALAAVDHRFGMWR